jgi:CDP-diacylglycerol--serine O-phosphatidyltransferase
VLLWHKLGISVDASRVIILVMLYVLGFLMVSNLRYYSFKKAELFRRMNFNFLVAAILLMIFIAAQPSIALFLIGASYVISGPVLTVLHYRRLKSGKKETHEVDEQSSST